MRQELYDRIVAYIVENQEKFYRLAYSYVRNQEDALDIVQNIMKLRFYEELSLKEIAEITRMNLNTVKAKLYRGLKLLKLNIQEVE